MSSFATEQQGWVTLRTTERVMARVDYHPHYPRFFHMARMYIATVPVDCGITGLLENHCWL
jgi:hypothetical protein